MRVFLDTNVLVSAFATRGLCADLLQLVLVEHQLVTGEAVLAELRRVLKEKLNVPPTVVDEIEGFVRQEAEVTDTSEPADLELRDPDDLLVLGEAIAGRVDIFVTGDRELAETSQPLPFPVVTPREFWKQLVR